MPDTSANGFCETVDYWKRVMDVLVPPDQRDPLACFNCYVQATTCPIHPIYYGDKFYRGLCLMCLGKKFWIVDELPREYLDIVIPPEMHATTTPQIYEMMQYMGFLSSGKNPNIWVRKADAIAYAKTILPPEETSEKGVLCIGGPFAGTNSIVAVIPKLGKKRLKERTRNIFTYWTSISELETLLTQ